MDDSFEDLTVPDDWIDIINNSQKQSDGQSQDDEAPPRKLQKLSVEQTDGKEEFPLKNLKQSDGQSQDDEAPPRKLQKLSVEQTNGEEEFPLKQSDGQSQNDEAPSPKFPKLSVEQTKGEEEFSLRQSDDIQKGKEASVQGVSCDIPNEKKDESSDEPFENGLKNEVVPLNESASLNSSTENIPISITDTLRDCNYQEKSIDNNDAASAKSLDTILSDDSKITADVNVTTVNKSGNAIVDISPQNSSRTEIQKSNSVAQDAKYLNSIFPQVHQSKIYDMLMKERSKENRLEIVSTKLLELETADHEQKCSNNNVCPSDDDLIFTDVALVIKELPMVDANKVYAVLESLPPTSDRVQNVITLLKSETSQQGKSGIKEKPVLLKKDSSLIDDPVLKNDPIFCDMRLIAKMFPGKDRNEIYALLEANIAQPNRVQVVVNEFLTAERQDPKVIDIEDENNGVPSDVPGPNSTPTQVQGLPLREEVERLTHLFPDCDPDYLFEKLELLKDKPERCHILAGELFEKKDYPKLKDKLEKLKKEEPCKREFTVEEFLEKFPDPQKTFSNEDEQVSQNYQQNAFVMLKNAFPMMKVGYLRSVLAKHRHHLLTSYQEISTGLIDIPLVARRHHGRFLLRPRTYFDPVPIDSNQYFIHEQWYTCNEQKVKDHIKKKEIERLMKFTEAKEKGELYECCCCYDDECLFEDLASCPEGHLFCKVCVIRSTEAAFGEMKTKFPCLTGECDQCLPLSTLQSIVPANLFSKIVSRIQEEEVQQANIPDLVTCPYCPFATIMPNLDDKVFKCLNPECLKESCRLCREENHVPLKCNEVESKAGRSMRTFIENYIAEAVIRKCHNCGKKFVKDSGCNKMTCICHATSCYACKEKDIDYNHFNENTRCANTDPETIHQRDMEQAATEARNKYLLEHPEASEAQLDTDFNKWFQNLSDQAQKNVTNRVDFEEDDSLSSDEEENDSYDEDDSSDDNNW